MKKTILLSLLLSVGLAAFLYSYNLRKSNNLKTTDGEARHFTNAQNGLGDIDSCNLKKDERTVIYINYRDKSNVNRSYNFIKDRPIIIIGSGTEESDYSWEISPFTEAGAKAWKLVPVSEL